MGVRNRKKMQYRDDVQNTLSRNIAAVLLFVAAAVLFVLLVIFWRGQQLETAKFHEPFLYWLQSPEGAGYQTHVRVTQQNANLTNEAQLVAQLETWRKASEPISMAYLFGQFSLAEDKVWLHDTRSDAVDVIGKLIASAKESPKKKLIALLDLGDGLRMNSDFIDRLQRQLDEAPENLWLIVSHHNQQSSRWLEQTNSTVFETALRQVLSELPRETNLKEFHKAITDWVAALTLDCEGKALQTVPPVLGRKRDGLADIRWKWVDESNTLTGNQQKLLKFEKVQIPSEANKQEIVKLEAIDSVEGFVVHKLPSRVLKHVKEKKDAGTESSLGSNDDGRFEILVARLSCDLALYRFAVDGGLLNHASQQNLANQIQELLDTYGLYMQPNSDPPPTVMLNSSAESIERFNSAIERFESELGQSIKRSNAEAKSLFHAQQMQLWNAFLADWRKRHPDFWPAREADDETKTVGTWPVSFDSLNLAPIDIQHLPRSFDPTRWRYEETKKFNLTDRQLSKFPQSLVPLLDWRWPSQDLISQWQFSKVPVPGVTIVLQPQQPTTEKLEFNISATAVLKGKVSFQHAPNGIELRVDGVSDGSWSFDWTVEPLQAPPGVLSDSESESPISLRGRAVRLLPENREGDQPSDSGEYQFTVRIKAPAEPGTDVGSLSLIASGRNSDGKTTDRNLEYVLDLMPPLEFEMHVETHFPGMENSSRKSDRVSVESNRVILSSLPNLVTEYQFWLSSANFSAENVERIDNHWDLELSQGGRVLASGKAVFNAKHAESPRFISWKGIAVEVQTFDSPFQIVVRNGERIVRRMEFQVDPRDWSELVKTRELDPEGWAQQPFLFLPRNSVDPVKNWQEYNAVWEAVHEEFLGKLRKEGVVAEYRIWSSAEGQSTDVVKFDEFKNSGDRLFPPERGATDVVLVASIYGWPQALRYRIDTNGVQDRDEALYGVFLKPIDCDIEPKSPRKWSGSESEAGWYFFAIDPKNRKLPLRIVAEDHDKARLEARWYINLKPRADESKAVFQVRYETANSLIGKKDFQLPTVTRCHWLGPLEREAGSPEFDRISVCTTVAETAVLEPGVSVNLLQNLTIARNMSFKLQSREVSKSDSEYHDLIVLDLERVPPKKSE